MDGGGVGRLCLLLTALTMVIVRVVAVRAPGRLVVSDMATETNAAKRALCRSESKL